MFAELRKTAKALPTVAPVVRDSLYASEKASAAVIAATAELSMTILSAGYDANLAASVGQSALARAIRAQSLFIDGRQELIAAHEALAEVQATFRIRMDDDGSDFGGPLKPPFPGTGMEQLRVVA